MIEKKESKLRAFMSEFKTFISKGSVIDLAVGVMIGTAFTGIVNSLVKDVVMPFIGIFIGGLSFENLKYMITPAGNGAEEAAIYYGLFIQNAVNFLILAFIVFVSVKIISKLRKKEDVEPEVAEPSEDVLLLREIRDLLKEQGK